jgi:hypothetical protein
LAGPDTEELRSTPAGASQLGCDRLSLGGCSRGGRLSDMEFNQLIWLAGVGIILLIAAILGGIV